MKNAENVIETVVEFPSSNGTDTVVGYFYTCPDVQPVAIVQISHGMIEYVRRYAALAGYLAAQGYAVCGNDHLGHGATSSDTGRDGYFAEQNGADFVLEDLHAMSEQARSRFPGLPLFLLGHSMGSFFARWYAERWGSELQGLILSGTAGPNPASGIGLALTELLTTLRGSTARSAFIEKLAFGAYCKRIPNAVTGKEWVTSDPEQLAAYVADPKCSFTFTVSAYQELMRVLRIVSRKAWASTLPKTLPVFLFAGKEDPVGSYGKGVQLVTDRLRAAGVQDVTLKLFDGCRHEVLNEGPAVRAEIFADILQWLNGHLPGRQPA